MSNATTAYPVPRGPELLGQTVVVIAEVTLVALDIVQLLARCEAKGVELLNCPALHP